MFAVSAAWYTEQCVPRPFSQLWGFAVGFFLWGLGSVFGSSNPKFGGMKLLLSLA
jgi:hypothetical protein